MSGAEPPRLPWLPTAPVAFPDPSYALDDPDGLLAAGGDLSREWLLHAYSQGIFPWFNDDAEPICWWSPATRGVFFPDDLHVSRSLKKQLRRVGWRISFDRAFPEVVQCCASVRAESGTWITPRMQRAYENLHRAGYAHSLEVWAEDVLVGGIYGISLGRMFFGESMFSLKSNASKIALLGLTEHMWAWKFDLLDCQMMNPHLQRMGAVPVPRAQFLQALAKNRPIASKVGCWQDELLFSTCNDLLSRYETRTTPTGLGKG